MSDAGAKLVIVGQGPNRAAWQAGIARGTALVNKDPSTPVNYPLATDRFRVVEKHAEAYCARVAVTGAVGRKLAELAGAKPLRFYATFARRNLNAKWNGKSSKGDVFDRKEAEAAARVLLEGQWSHYLLLGQEVARAFGVNVGLLELSARFDEKNRCRNFLVFPHPSGINLWWNDRFNEFRAIKRLREFIASAEARP